MSIGMQAYVHVQHVTCLLYTCIVYGVCVLDMDYIYFQTCFCEDQLGHYWKSVALSKPEKCDACKEIIWSSSLTCQGINNNNNNTNNNNNDNY